MSPVHYRDIQASWQSCLSWHTQTLHMKISIKLTRTFKDSTYPCINVFGFRKNTHGEHTKTTLNIKLVEVGFLLLTFMLKVNSVKNNTTRSSNVFILFTLLHFTHRCPSITQLSGTPPLQALCSIPPRHSPWLPASLVPQWASAGCHWGKQSGSTERKMKTVLRLSLLKQEFKSDDKWKPNVLNSTNETSKTRLSLFPVVENFKNAVT